MQNIQPISAVVLSEKLKQIVVDRQEAKISNLSYCINGQTQVVWVPSEKTLFVGVDAKPFKGNTIEEALVTAQLQS